MPRGNFLLLPKVPAKSLLEVSLVTIFIRLYTYSLFIVVFLSTQARALYSYVSHETRSAPYPVIA